MKPPPRYSVSPLHSFGVVPIAVRRGGPTLFGAMLGAIWRHLTGRRSPNDIDRENREVHRIAREFAAEAEANKVPGSGGNPDASIQRQRKANVRRKSRD